MPFFKSILSLIRVKQWLKNLMIFFPPFLGGTLFQTGVAEKGVAPFVAFCLASSATYIINDITDISCDRQHPLKQKRPIASGLIKVGSAKFLASTLMLTSLVIAIGSSRTLLLLLLSYLVISNAYSFSLKNIPVVDLFCISSGFLIRLLAGGAAFSVKVSEWLFLSVLLLSLFLSTGKRLGEKSALGDCPCDHRKVLDAYPDGFLDGILYMTGASVLVTYAMYAVSRHSSLLLATVVVCSFGLIRYVFMVKSGKGGDPTESLLQDKPLLLTGILWTAMIGWGLYGR